MPQQVLVEASALAVLQRVFEVEPVLEELQLVLVELQLVLEELQLVLVEVLALAVPQRVLVAVPALEVLQPVLARESAFAVRGQVAEVAGWQVAESPKPHFRNEYRIEYQRMHGNSRWCSAPNGSQLW